MNQDEIERLLNGIQVGEMSDEERIDEMVDLWEDAESNSIDISIEKLTKGHPHLADNVAQKIAMLKRFLSRHHSAQPVLQSSVLAGTRYRVCEAGYVASGGLGDVFRVHDEVLGRDVAYKRPQDRWQGHPEILERLEREARLTAALEHPGIVPTYEYGHDASGRPYYAMRLIHGKSLRDVIREYHDLRSRLLPAEQSLKLRGLVQRLITVCNALAYAHSRGVVHRDVKPDNILLGEFGETFLVDWGIATKTYPDEKQDGTASDSTIIPKGTQTQPGKEMGTYGFMSPEQARGEWDRVGPASDVFSLGATLYAILTNQPPYKGPEKVVHSKTGTFMPPEKVVSFAPLQLSAICCKSMSADPLQRYATASDLASELERWLADEPVTCFSDSISTRLFRWIRRHKTKAASVMAATVVAAIAVTVGIVLLGYKNQQLVTTNTKLDNSRHELELKNELLQKRAKQLGTSNEILASIISGIDLQTPDNKNLTLAEVLGSRLKLAATRFDEEFAEDVAVRSRMKLMLADSLLTFGHYREALSLVDESLSIMDSQESTAQKDRTEAILLRSMALHALGKHDESIRLLKELIDNSEQDRSKTDPLVFAAINNLAEYLSIKGDFEEAIKLQKEVLESETDARGPNHPDTLTKWNNLGNSYLRVARFTEAAEIFEEVLKRRTEVLGSESRQTLVTLHSLASARGGQGNAKEAIELMQQVHEKRLTLFGAAHPDTLDAADNLAIMLSSAPNPQRAIDLLQDVIRKKMDTLGESHPGTLYSLSNLGAALLSSGATTEAIRILESVFEKQKQVLGSDSDKTLTTGHNLARAYQYDRKNDKAIELCEWVVEHRRKALPTNHPDTLATMSNLAQSLFIKGDHSKAIELQEELLDKYVNIFGETHSATILTMENLAFSYQMVGRFIDAVNLLERFSESLEHKRGSNDIEALAMKGRLAQARSLNGEKDRARADLKLVLQTQESSLGWDHPHVIESLQTLSRLQVDLGEKANAVQSLLSAAERLNSQKTAKAGAWSQFIPLIDALTFLDATAEAVQWCRICQSQCEAEFGKESLAAMSNQERLIRILVRKGDYQDALTENEEWLKKAASKTLANSIPAHSLANIQSLKGECLLKLDRLDEAETILIQSHKILNSIADDGSVPIRADLILLSLDRLIAFATKKGDNSELSRLQTERDIVAADKKSATKTTQ